MIQAFSASAGVVDQPIARSIGIRRNGFAGRPSYREVWRRIGTRAATREEATESVRGVEIYRLGRATRTGMGTLFFQLVLSLPQDGLSWGTRRCISPPISRPIMTPMRVCSASTPGQGRGHSPSSGGRRARAPLGDPTLPLLFPSFQGRLGGFPVPIDPCEERPTAHASSSCHCNLASSAVVDF